MIGFFLFFFRQARFLSLYLILVSTMSVCVSLVLSTAWLWLVPKIFDNPGSWVRWAFLALYLASVAFGGLIEGLGGFVAARKMNQRFRWTSSI